ncbi:MAG: hypothetical protein COW32_10280 [Candidatus Aquicultor secundus]|uniref:Uncharacterized protein n=1 Tax=Candidatus Aquicultor secundus TaxID=1973895 RepID=A0A2M7T8Q0_9ACTN|nr:hypothetical protein [Candidatus Aquicultor secundus]NCO65149.1 hypothetical protein [Solirubrobacter sp.]OIO87022.1 MAG: hypothetical protein AUK32_04610 [Candidatus Aquicultor secundus]PIU28093.1 MAG: hypothetical protein COT10_00055 [Candidatus Aquicultor secundus]PIW21375.1 MAG: hypothetical protein COW32_10280 [Candidatus Aquicultor secundus]PIX52793.1 MAG: hypothetical protein COZ51_02240 [Candidatus Aquicultor secundus]
MVKKVLVAISILFFLAVNSIAAFVIVERQHEIAQFNFLVEQAKALSRLDETIAKDLANTGDSRGLGVVEDEAPQIKSKLVDRSVVNDLRALKSNLVLISEFQYELARFEGKRKSDNRDSRSALGESEKMKDEAYEFFKAHERVKKDIERFCKKWKLNSGDFKIRGKLF